MELSTSSHNSRSFLSYPGAITRPVPSTQPLWSVFLHYYYIGIGYIGCEGYLIWIRLNQKYHFDPAKKHWFAVDHDS